MHPTPFVQTSVQLPNGLQVVFIEASHFHTSLISLYVNTGSRFETKKENGLSHLLEHMLFRGTKRYPNAFLLNQAVESLGGTLYAETRRDSSLYQLALPKENTKKGLVIIEEILNAPTFCDLEIEKNIVKEELYEDLDAKGQDINLTDLSYAQIFKGHPLGQKISGTLQQIESFQLSDLKRFFKKHYGAQNMVLCIAGAFSLASILPFVEQLFSSLPGGKKTTLGPPPQPITGPLLHHQTSNHSQQTALVCAFLGPGEQSPKFPTLLMLLRILDDGLSTRLYQRIVNELGLAYYTSAGVDSFCDTSVVSLEASAAHTSLAQLFDETMGILSSLKTKHVLQKELSKAKQRSRWDTIAVCDDLAALSDWFARTRLFMMPPSFEERLEQIETITASDIITIAQEIFQQNNLLFFSLGKQPHKKTYQSQLKTINKL